jgi:hypothetical protein
VLYSVEQLPKPVRLCGALRQDNAFCLGAITAKLMIEAMPSIISIVLITVAISGGLGGAYLANDRGLVPWLLTVLGFCVSGIVHNFCVRFD